MQLKGIELIPKETVYHSLPHNHPKPPKRQLKTKKKQSLKSRCSFDVTSSREKTDTCLSELSFLPSPMNLETHLQPNSENESPFL